MTQMGWMAGHARETSHVIRGLEPEPVCVSLTSGGESKARDGLKPMVRIQPQLCGDIPVRTLDSEAARASWLGHALMSLEGDTL